MVRTAQPKWVQRLRGACPKGWSVKNIRGKVFLSVRSGAGGANASTMTLPIAWAADTVPETVQLIHRQKFHPLDMVDNGQTQGRQG